MRASFGITATRRVEDLRKNFRSLKTSEVRRTGQLFLHLKLGVDDVVFFAFSSGGTLLAVARGLPLHMLGHGMGGALQAVQRLANGVHVRAAGLLLELFNCR